MNKGLKIALWVGIPLIGIGGGVLAYRNLVPPNFSIEEIDHLKKGGKFRFSGREHSFGSGAGASVIVGRGNWKLKYAYDSKEAFFILMKNGKEIKELERITYQNT